MRLKKLFPLAMLVIFSLNLHCQVQWIKYPGNPVMEPGPPGAWDEDFIAPSSVLYYDSTYHMWYMGGQLAATSRIGHATSPDGVHWTKDTVNNPVLSMGQTGDWDENSIQGGYVLEIDSIFHMWYTGHSGSLWNANYRIGHATSPDGVTWTKDTNNPVLGMGPDGTWDDTWITGGTVIFDGSEYHMWYGASNSRSRIHIGHATSPDGFTWTKDPSNPVLRSGSSISWDNPRVEIPSVVFDGTTYHMWYSGGNWFGWQIGYATSEDGSSWEKDDNNNPVLSKRPDGSWDAKMVGLCSVINSSGSQYKMWYCGNELEATGSIGYAVSQIHAWKEMEPMDIERGAPLSAVNEHMIYVFGGIDNKVETLSSARAYNSITNEWTGLAAMPKDLYEGNAEVVNGKIYLIGGWRNVNGSLITTNSTVEYDPDGDFWQEKTGSPEAMGGMASCVLNDTIYILGGSRTSDTQDKKKAWYYAPGTDSWGSLPDMMHDRPGGASAVTLDNKIYVIGGTYESGLENPTGKAEVYDPQLKTWTELTNMPAHVVNHICVVYDQKILVFGGDSSQIFDVGYGTSIGTNIIQEYDPSTDSWKLVKGMPIKRASMAGERVENFMYLMGGYLNSRDLDAPLSEVWRFNIESLNAFISVSGISLDTDSLILIAGNSATLYPTVSPFDASDPSITWTSGNVAVATVANGTVTGETSGEAYIYMTTVDGNFKDSCLVTVKNIWQVRFGSTGDPLNGLTVSWRSSGTSDSIAWGYTSGLEKGEYAALKSSSITGTQFEYTFPVLNAGSTIHYKLFDSNASLWTEELTFITASDASSDQFSFTVLGDSRSYPADWGIISEATLDTDFTLFMGDIVESGSNVSDWLDWFEYGAEFISREPVYHCIGNHDDDDSPSGYDNYLGLFTLPGNEMYFSFTYGNAVFICLNTQEPEDPVQYNWLLSTLEANKDQTWKILFFHKPFFTAPNHTGEMDDYFNTWWKAFDDYGIDMIFNGHTHNYQRTKPINRNVSKNSGVEVYGSGDGQGRCQIVAGNAGAPLSDAASSSLWWLDNSVSKRHFCNIDIDGNKLTMKAMDANLVVFDELVLVHTGINDFRSTSSRVYPNPTYDLLTIETGTVGHHTIKINSLNGHLISSFEMEGTSHQLDLSTFQKGVYFITIRSKDFVTTRKIIKL